MKIFADLDEASERLEELIELARRRHVVICRGERPIALLSPYSEAHPVLTENFESTSAAGHSEPQDGGQSGKPIDPMESFLALAAEDRRHLKGKQTSAHDDLYDENGLPR